MPHAGGIGFPPTWRPRPSAALGEHRLSIQFVNDVVDAIAGCIAAGDDLVVNHHSSRRRLVAKFLAARGHVEIVPGDLLRPIGARDGELFR